MYLAPWVLVKRLSGSLQWQSCTRLRASKMFSWARVRGGPLFGDGRVDLRILLYTGSISHAGPMVDCSFSILFTCGLALKMQGLRVSGFQGLRVSGPAL